MNLTKPLIVKWVMTHDRVCRQVAYSVIFDVQKQIRFYANQVMPWKRTTGLTNPIVQKLRETLTYEFG